MAVVVRLRRMGCNKKPFYRVVAADERKATTGRFLENLGWYDPKRADTNYEIKLDRVDYWLGQGARITDTVRSLVRKARKAATVAAAAVVE